MPVDYCANHILACTAQEANKRRATVHHYASSSKNPLTWKDTRTYFFEYFRMTGYDAQITRPEFRFYQHKSAFRVVCPPHLVDCVFLQEEAAVAHVLKGGGPAW